MSSLVSPYATKFGVHALSKSNHFHEKTKVCDFGAVSFETDLGMSLSPLNSGGREKGEKRKKKKKNERNRKKNKN